ncbi:hypothetical protein [Pseudaquabacterium rugosum]|uniref:Uncharacterized protein n=1 Tax=Pseudaquabacterium rugosum TaxID=2984194 RepID=A0ABU9BBF3_9BURK
MNLRALIALAPAYLRAPLSAVLDRLESAERRLESAERRLAALEKAAGLPSA